AQPADRAADGRCRRLMAPDTTGALTTGERPVGQRGLGGPGSPPLKSAAQRVASFDVDVFPVPGGREEEWRFTPRLRMKRLFEDAPGTTQLKWTTDLPDGIEVRDLSADDPLLRQVPAPLDRTA